MPLDGGGRATLSYAGEREMVDARAVATVAGDR